jgi:hypothetical protein
MTSGTIGDFVEMHILVGLMGEGSLTDMIGSQVLGPPYVPR